MVTEHPEDGQAWAEAHQHWSGFASGLFESVREAFEALTAIQFDAPWKNDPDTPRESDPRAVDKCRAA